MFWIVFVRVKLHQIHRQYSDWPHVPMQFFVHNLASVLVFWCQWFFTSNINTYVRFSMYY